MEGADVVEGRIAERPEGEAVKGEVSKAGVGVGVGVVVVG